MRRIAVVALLAAGAAAAHARGVSPYLPLHQSPEIERQIERVLILADRPVLTRPIAAAAVLDALPRACERDPVLCEQVRRYLRGYMRSAGIASLSVSAATRSGDATPLPNRHGMTSDSRYELSGAVYFQPSDHVLVTAGVLAHEDETTPTGSVVSFGVEQAQLDVGYRDHWWSPLTDSAMPISTQAATMPSITVSNYTPLSRLGFRYEVFVAEMSESSNIGFEGGVTQGSPRLAGLHLSIQPVDGWTLGVSRVMQYGGGERSASFGDLLEAFFNAKSADNTGTDADFGNQIASFTSSFVVPTAVPFSVYLEYAGEDTSTLSNFRLGNAALSAGIRLPVVGPFDVTVEASEWQNGWYVHHIYRDGLRHEDNVIGHWGGDWRQTGDGVGGRSFMARLAWRPPRGGVIEATYRSLDNESYSGVDYERGHLLEVRYSRSWRQFQVGAEVAAGRNVFGESFSRAGLFLRY
ncbi:MAG TPA: capsule assembly Wzi family protein [Gammaproteobacteria bacterium]